MITLKEWMEIVDYRITEGDKFTWVCFTDNAYTLSAWNGDHNGWSFCITFDTVTQVVFMVEACDYKHQRAYRLINPDWVKSFEQYSPNVKNQAWDNVKNQAWDDVNYIDLDVDDDWIQKALAIKSGKPYDTRVAVPIELEDSEMFKLMTMAHERDITLNKLIEEILWEQIKKHESTS